jgi:hypothetical protein
VIPFLVFKVAVYGSAKSSFSQDYLKYTLKIMEEEKHFTEFPTSSDGRVPAGKHHFRFSFLIPSDAPASFKLDYANRTCYSVRTELDIPWRFNKIDHVYFHVDRRDDFSSFHLFKVPKIQDIVDIHRNFWMTISIPYIVFTPGSSIPISIQIVNKSSKAIGRVRIRLIQKVEKRG